MAPELSSDWLKSVLNEKSGVGSAAKKRRENKGQ